MREAFDPWRAVVFCAFLSLITLSGRFGMGMDSGTWTGFFYFLPMCFFYVGAQIAAMQREVRSLRFRLTALEQERNPGPQDERGDQIVANIKAQ
jgi:hypothetical protein